MNLQIALFILGGILLLLGLTGRLELHQLKVGTDNKGIRLLCGLLGIATIIFSLTADLKYDNKKKDQIVDQKINSSIQESNNEYFIVIKSSPSKDEAIEKSKELLEFDFKVEVYSCENGQYAVVIGKYNKERAENILEKFVKGRLKIDDAFRTAGKSFIRKVYP